MLLLLFIVFVAFATLVAIARRPASGAPAIRRAYVMGVNYFTVDYGDDPGCLPDLASIADRLRRSEWFREEEVFMFVNDRAEGKHFTSKIGIQKRLTKAAERSHVQRTDLILFHFSGWVDENGLLTSDGEVVSHEWLARWKETFAEGARVVVSLNSRSYDSVVEAITG